MQSLWLLTRKNLKLLFRSKSSSLIVFFAPLLTILILGLSYNNSPQYGLNIGIVAPSVSADVDGVMKALQEQGFRTVTYDANIDTCVDDIKSGVIHTCMVLPESFQVDGNTPKEVVFHLDPSKINLVWMIQETLKTRIDFKSQEISQSLAQQLLTKLQDAKTGIGDNKNQLGAIKEKSSAASTSVSSAQSSLTGLDLAAPEAAYDTAIITTTNTEIQNALTKIVEARTELNEANMSTTDKNSVKSALDEAETQLNSAFVSMNGSIATLITSLQNDLSAAKTKLSAAATAIDGSASGLSSATTTLQEANTALDTVQAALSTLQSNLESQQVTEPGTVANPIVTRIEKVAKDSTFLNYTFPTLLVLVIMFSSLLLGTILVMMEKNSPAFLRNYFLPIKKTTFIISIYLTNLILILIQIIILLGISLLFLQESLPALPSIALILFISASVFIFLGMAIGYLFASEETAVLASISAGSILLFVSGVVLPLEAISPSLRDISAFNPFVLSEKIIREIFIFGSSLAQVWQDLIILIGYAIVLFLVILIIESFLHRQLVHKFLKRHHEVHRQQDQVNKNDV